MSPLVRDWGPVLVAVIVPGIGTVYSNGQRDADAKAAQAKIAEIERKVAASSELSAAAAVRVDQLELRAKATDDVLRDLTKTMQRLDGNMIAVCAATRGAQCVR